MKIVFINTPIYDYLTATLIEGLTEIGQEVVCSEASNYGRALPDAELVQVAEQADLIVIGSNVGVRHHLMQSVVNPRKVFIDGSDFAGLGVPTAIRFKAVFKRELCRKTLGGPPSGVHPLPFAAEKRYFMATQPKKDILVSFIANMDTNPLRNSIHVRLQNMQNPAVVSGSTNERAYNPGSARQAPVDTPVYRQLLGRSMISVNVPGAGYDCARYWEILAARAMLMTYEPDILIPDGFTDGVDCATFASLDEFDSKLKFYTANPERAVRIAENGTLRLMQHHTTARRAYYFLECATAAVQRPDYCSGFLHPEIRAIESVCIGRGIDVGCGSNKTTPGCIGVDLTARGATGIHGSETGRISVADVASSGDDLKDFNDGSLDFVVARHNLEHYHNPSKTLSEWKRVLRVGGRMGVVVPDHAAVNTYALDPTHYCHFTMESFSEMINTVGGLKIDEIGVCVPNWSFKALLTRTA
jgi:SAM-dependent methyltransferase